MAFWEGAGKFDRGRGTILKFIVDPSFYNL